MPIPRPHDDGSGAPTPPHSRAARVAHRGARAGVLGRAPGTAAATLVATRSAARELGGFVESLGGGSTACMWSMLLPAAEALTTPACMQQIRLRLGASSF